MLVVSLGHCTVISEKLHARLALRTLPVKKVPRIFMLVRLKEKQHLLHMGHLLP